MTALHHPRNAVAARSSATPWRWRSLQAGLLGGALVALAAVMYLGAAPGGAALRQPPTVPTAGPEAAAERVLPSPSVRQHVVLLVEEAGLGETLRRRILEGELISGEFGAYAPPIEVEVIVGADAASVAALTAGLREFEARCAAEACPSIRVLDLRHSGAID